MLVSMNQLRPSRTRMSYWAYLAGIMVSYYCLAAMALYLSKEPGSVAMVWYPNIAAGLLLARLPYRFWPAGLVAVLIPQLGISLSLPQTLSVNLVFSCTALSNVSLIAYFTKKSNNFEQVYDSPVNYAKALVVIAIVPAAISATVAAIGLFLNGFQNIDKGWVVSFTSIVLGGLTIGAPGIALSHFGFKKCVEELLTTWSLGFLAIASAVSIYAFLHLAYPFAYLALTLVVAALFTNIITISFAASICSILITTITSFQLYVPNIDDPSRTGILFYLPVMIILIPSVVLSVSQHARTLVMDKLEEQMTSTRDALLNMPALLCTIDAGGNAVLASKRFLRIMELDTTELIGYPFSKIVVPESMPTYDKEILNTLQKGDLVENVMIKVRSRYGREIYLSVSASFESNGHPNQKVYHLHIQNISEEVRLSEKLMEENELMEITLRSIGDGVVATDSKGDITFINAVAETLLYTSTDVATGKHFNDVIHLYDEQSGKRLDCPVDRVMQEKTVQGIPDFAVLKNINGDTFGIQDSISPITNQKGEVVGTIMVFQDVTETRKISQKMSYLAQHDMLTDLPNRILLMDRINLAIARTKRSAYSFCVVFMDLDNFKTINDTQGHEAGDQLLQVIASRLRKHVRGEDTISRIGGDEFVFVFEGISDSTAVTRICDKVIDDVRQPMIINHKSISVSCSMGAALCPTDGEDSETLMRRADAAMYRAKHTGRNRVCFYSHQIEKVLSRQVALEDDLRTAFKQEEFFLYYQPIVDSDTGEVYATEALCRWKNPKTGEMVAPATFIPVLENIGLINDVGKYILEAACKQMTEWKGQGKELNMSINISARQVADSSFIDSVATILSSYNLSGTRFIFEITESLLLTNTDQCISVLRKLRSMGIRIAIDDFGCGYSSLSYLKKFPFDVLKIDKQFVQELGSSQQDVIFVKAILDMAKALSLKTVAEGVENEQQVRILQNLNCDALQGFYFSAAESGQQIRARMGHNNNILRFPA
ncbi:bifunctional diguanylate cyclase/phosphodiesterase [Gynuella sp.]|uniref:bifunctional diguanylate cyclase/phosphodiesterase n=2 Tax=Gynuella sp. TaxID=2969146 RepID=UPI003D09C482